MTVDDSGGRRRIHLREISGESETALETVGRDLRAARLRRGDDLATVSRALKIRKDHLEAVEEDNFAQLPGKTYAIGFVRTYAGYLGLDAVKTVERYKLEISGRHDDHMPPPSYHIDDSRRLTYGWRVVAGVIGLALIYGVWHLVSPGPSPQPVPPAPALSPQRPQVSAAAPVAPPPQTAPATGTTAQPPPAASNVAAAAPAVGATAVPPPAASSTAQLAAPSATGKGEVYGKMNTGARVILRAVADTRVTVRGPDGTIYLNRDLKAGDSYQVPNIGGLSLAANDGGAVDVVVDGKDMGKAGQNLQILASVSLDPSSLVDRPNSH